MFNIASSRGNRMKKIKLAAATVFLALGAMPALAQEAPRPIYVGIALGQAHAKRLCADATVACDERSGATRYFAGYQFHRNFGVEASYTNLERFNTGGAGVG